MRAKHWGLVVAAIAAVIFVRTPTLFLHPVLFAEDGNLFEYYYSHRALAGIWRGYAGYVAVLPNTVGWLTMAFPVRAAPFLFAWVALACAALSFASVRAASALIPSEKMRAVLAVAAAAMPLATFAEVSMAADCLWSLLIATTVLSISTPPDASLRRQGLAAFLRVLTAATNPMGLCLVAIDLAGLWRRRWALRLVHASAIAAAGVVKLLAVGSATPPSALVAAKMFFVGLPERVAAEAFLGSQLRWAIRERLPGGAFAVGVLVMAALAWLTVRVKPTGEHRRQLLWLVAIIVLLQAAAIAGRGGLWDLLSRWNERYFYVQKLLLLLIFASLFLQLRLSATARRATAIGLILAILGANYLNRGDYREPEFAGESERVSGFTHDLAALESQHGGRRDFVLTLRRAGDASGMWPITADARSP